MSAKKKNAKKPLAVWRDYVRRLPGGKCVRVTRSPDGRDYYGTSREVLEARLSPEFRERLAKSQRFARARRDLTGDERRQVCAWNRRDAIRYGLIEQGLDPDGLVTDIHVAAAARYMGKSVAVFTAEALWASIQAVVDLVHGDGLEELPLTRHERRALAALAEKKGGAK